jgi:poly [ADP-ribose] polymerase
LKEKLKLVETLQDIEIATALLKADPNDESSNAIDQSYKKLNTAIKPLDKTSDLYKTLEKYAVQTHDSKYFSNFKIEVLDIFEVERDGEGARFKQWEKNEVYACCTKLINFRTVNCCGTGHV